MNHVQNKFGSGILYDEFDLLTVGKIYAACTACMSIYSEFLTWANAFENKMVKSPWDADAIIVLSCQVTDLAVLNDLRCLEDLMDTYPGRKYFIGGCLAKRFDIELPAGVMRLDNVVSDQTPITDFDFVDYRAPFWVKEFETYGHDTASGHLFRNMYPLRIGVGCKNSCQYCTIRHTRGAPYTLKPNIAEFLSHEDVVLIADSPTKNQIEEWCTIAKYTGKPISIRNIEPHVAVQAMGKIYEIAQKGLLKIFHCPVQSTNSDALADMGRNYKSTFRVLDDCLVLKSENVFTATNIIIDYKNFPNPGIKLLRYFDYVSWNPYWDGNWDRETAEQRFQKYLG